MKYALLKCDDVFEILTRAPFPAEDEDAPVDANAENDNINHAVEQHLSCCYACRALAEALRPATGLFHESMAGEQRSSLPSYHGPKRPLPAVGVAKSVLAAMGDCAVAESSCRHGLAMQKHRGLAMPTRRFSASSQRATAVFSSGLALTALLIFGTAIYTNTGGFTNLGDSGNPALFSRTPSTAPAPFSSSNTFSASNIVAPTLGGAEQYLAALGLPAACREPRKELKNVVASAATFALGGDWRCCTECHAAGKQVHTAPVNAVAVVRSESCRVCHTP